MKTSYYKIQTINLENAGDTNIIYIPEEKFNMSLFRFKILDLGFMNQEELCIRVKLSIFVNDNEYLVKMQDYKSKKDFALNFNADRFLNEYIIGLEKMTFNPLSIKSK